MSNSKNKHHGVDYAIFFAITGVVYVFITALIIAVADNTPVWIYVLGLCVSASIGYVAGFMGDPLEVPQTNSDSVLEQEHEDTFTSEV